MALAMPVCLFSLVPVFFSFPCVSGEGVADLIPADSTPGSNLPPAAPHLVSIIITYLQLKPRLTLHSPPDCFSHLSGSNSLGRSSVLEFFPFSCAFSKLTVTFLCPGFSPASATNPLDFSPNPQSSDLTRTPPSTSPTACLSLALPPPFFP